MRKNIALLYLVSFSLIVGSLYKPHMVLFGLFYLDSIPATFAIISLGIVCAIAGITALRGKRAAILLTKYYTSFIVLNSIVNLVALLFVYQDVQGFMLRIFGEDMTSGFIFIQVVAILANLWLYVAVMGSKRLFRG